MTDIAQLLEADPATMMLGDVVDALKQITTIRLLMDKEVEAVAAVERKFKAHLIDNIPKSNAAGAMGLRYKAVVKTKKIPKIKSDPRDPEANGWAELHEYIYNTGRFDLLQKRLNDKAVLDMIEAGETVPGVETMSVPDLSVTKI